MGKCMLFFDQSLKPAVGNNFKQFSLRMLMIKHQVSHKSESTTNTSRLWYWPTVKDMDILFHALSIVFMVQTSQYLQVQAEERLV